jgi:hypothetical protein
MQVILLFLYSGNRFEMWKSDDWQPGPPVAIKLIAVISAVLDCEIPKVKKPAKTRASDSDEHALGPARSRSGPESSSGESIFSVDAITNTWCV